MHWPPEVHAVIAAEVAVQIKLGHRLFSWLGQVEVESAAWLGAVKAYKNFDPARNVKLSYWISRRAGGQIRDVAQTEWRYRQAAVQAPEYFEQVSSENLARSIQQKCDARLILSRARLTPRHRELIQLYFFEDWTHKQIARKFGVTECAIFANFRTIYKRLRKAADSPKPPPPVLRSHTSVPY